MVAKKINPESMAPAIGFSHAVVVEGGTLVFLAGQTALNKEGVIEGNGIVEQFEKVITNLLTALSEAGGTPDTPDWKELSSYDTSWSDSTLGCRSTSRD